MGQPKWLWMIVRYSGGRDAECGAVCGVVVAVITTLVYVVSIEFSFDNRTQAQIDNVLR